VATSRSSSGSTDEQTLTIVHAPAAGSHFECDLGVTPIHDSYVGTGWVDNPVGLSVAVVACSPTSVTLTVTKALATRGISRVRFRGWLDTNAARQPVYPDASGALRVGFAPDGYGNAATLDYGGFVQRVTTALRRTPQGGSVRGDQARAAIDVESYAGAWTGVTFPGGVVALDDTGQPLRRPQLDHDGGPGLVVGPRVRTTVRFRVTNIGNETLNNVQVSATTVRGVRLGRLACLLGGSRTPPFQGLAPRQALDCGASLPARTSTRPRHVNRVTLTATSGRYGAPVTDTDLFESRRAIPVLKTRVAPVESSVGAGRIVTWHVTVANVGGARARSGASRSPADARQGFARRRAVYRIGTGRAVTAPLVSRHGVGCVTVPVLCVDRKAVISFRTRIDRDGSRRARGAHRRERPRCTAHRGPEHGPHGCRFGDVPSRDRG
jgi:hypothetical protein